MTTPAGWYNDGSGAQRYWDGNQWTDNIAPESAPASPVMAPRKKSRVWLYVGLGVGALILMVIIAVVAIVLLFRTALGGPQDAFHELSAAWQEKDCAAEYAVSMESLTMPVSEFCAMRDYSWVDADYADWNISVTGVERINDSATVTTRETFTDRSIGERRTETWNYSFEQIDGTWLYSGSTGVGGSDVLGGGLQGDTTGAQEMPPSPQQAFEVIVQTWQAKDCTAAYELSVESSTGMTLDEFCEAADYSWVDANYRDWAWSVVDVEELGDSATVIVSEDHTYAETGERITETWSYMFDWVDGEWLFREWEVLTEPGDE